MKSLKNLICILFFCSQAFNSSAFDAFFTFTKPTIVGNKFRITLNIENYTGGSTVLGSTIISIGGEVGVFSNPVLISENFPSGSYGNSVVTVQNNVTYQRPNSNVFYSVNQITLNTAFLNSQNQISIYLNQPIELAVIEFDIIPSSQIQPSIYITPATNLKRPSNANLLYLSRDIGNFSLEHLAAMSFKNSKVIGNKFRTTLNMASVYQNFGLGNFNLRLNYNSEAINNPKIVSSFLPSPTFGALTTTGSSSSYKLFTINGIYSGIANSNAFPILVTGNNIAEIEFDIVNPNVLANLSWRVYNLDNPRIAIVNDSKITSVLIDNAQNLIDFNLNLPVNAGADVTLDCNNPTTTLTAADGGGSYLWSTGETTKSIVVSPAITTTYSVTASNNTSDQVVVVFDCPPTLSSRVLLNQMANASLTAMPNFPLSSPYTNGAFNGNFINVNNNSISVINPSILATTGNNAIVDWLFLELRIGVSGATSVAYTKSALLQADGDIVDLDGISSVKFSGVIPGDYYIAVRHHNSLGFRTANKVALSSTLTSLDFTNPTALHGATPLVQMAPNVYTMIGGDANSDGSIDAFDTIVWELQNGLFDDYTQNADYNMDGSIDAFDSIIWELNNGNYQELD